MIIFNRSWVQGAMANFWEEMVGVRPTLPARTTGQTTPPHARGPVDRTYARKWVPYSELNAARLIDLQMDERITFVGEETSGDWYFWNGVYHQKVDSGIVADYACEAFTDQMVEAMNQVDQAIEAEVVQFAQQQGIPMNAQPVTDQRKRLKDLFKDHRAFERRLHSDAGLNALKSRFRKQVTESRETFDNDRRWLVCQNGVLDLEKFRERPVVADCMRPHDPELKVTRAIECNFNPQAKAPNWEHFLETSIPDEEVRAYLQRLVGAAFLAELKVKSIPNLVGPKDCGKTIFVSTLEKLAGGYGVQPSPKALMKENGTNFEQDQLRGMRFVGISEPSHTDKMDDTFCKQVTGGDPVSTRTLHSKSSTWLPQCVIFIASNQEVRFNTNDDAFLERIAIIKFPHQFFDASEAEPGEIHIKDYELEKKLDAEMEGIFLWVLRGMWEYTVGGARKPESVKRAGEAYAVESSGPLSWVAEKVDEGLLATAEKVSDYPKNSYVVLKKLYAAYNMDISTTGDKPVPQHMFSKHLENKYGKDRSGVTRIMRLIGTGAWAHMHDPKATHNSDLGL